RPGAAAARAAGGQRGQRGRRGSQDGAAVDARAGRRAGPAGGGEVCRALRPRGLQRPVRRPAAVPVLTPPCLTPPCLPRPCLTRPCLTPPCLTRPCLTRPRRWR